MYSYPTQLLVFKKVLCINNNRTATVKFVKPLTRKHGEGSTHWSWKIFWKYPDNKAWRWRCL